MIIIVIGESCVDKFVYCKIDRLSPEAPVPILIPIETRINEGMSGNVVKNLESIIGNTQTEEKIDLIHYTQTKKITKTRYIDRKTNHIFLRLDEGEEDITSFGSSDDSIELIKESDIVVVSDYNKGFLTNEDLKLIGENSKLSILDSKRTLTKEIVDSYSFIKLNETESKNNKNLLDSKNIIVTLGERGCSFNGKIYPSINPQETIDVSGAGDTFTSSFIWKYHQTKNVDLSINYANDLSSIVVSKRGVVTPF